MRKSFLLVLSVFIATQSFAAPPYSRPTIGQYKTPTYSPPPVRMPSTTPPITVPHIETPKNLGNPPPTNYKYKYEPLPYQQVPTYTLPNYELSDGIKNTDLREFYYTCFLSLPQVKFYNSAMVTNDFNEAIEEYTKQNARKKKFEIPEWIEPKLAEIDKTYAKEITEWDDSNINIYYASNNDLFFIRFDNCISLIGKNPADYHLAKDARIQKIAKNIHVYAPLIEENILPKYNFTSLIKAGDFIDSIEKQPIILQAMTGSPIGENFNKLKARYELANSQAKGNYHPLDKKGKPESFDCIIEDAPMTHRTQFDVERGYPKEALDKELDGRVDAYVQIDEHGNITNLDLVVSDPIFGGESMEKKLRALKYYPPIKNCITSAGSTRVGIRFFLN